MNKNTDYCKFVEDIKKEVQNIIKDWGAEAVFVPAGSPETEDCLIVKIPTDEGMGMQRFLMKEIYQDLRDKRRTMEEIVEEAENGLLEKYPDIHSLEECFYAAFHLVSDHRRAVLHIYHSVNREMFEEYLMRNCERVVRKYLSNSFGLETENTQNCEPVIRLLKCELFGLCIEWMNAGLPDSAPDSMQTILTLCHGLTKELLQRSKNISDI